MSGESTVRENPATEISLFTWGYQGRGLEELREVVRRYGIEQLLDVRENASSKKPGFAAAELRESMAKMGVAYVHLPGLGCAQESRHAFWRGEVGESFFEEYRRRLADRSEALADLVRRIRSGRTLLLCLERDPSRCHRAVLVERLHAEGVLAQDL